MIHAHLWRGLRAGLLGGKRQLSLVFEMQEEFARERRTGVSAGPEFAQASGSGW